MCCFLWSSLAEVADCQLVWTVCQPGLSWVIQSVTKAQDSRTVPSASNIIFKVGIVVFVLRVQWAIDSCESRLETLCLWWLTSICWRSLVFNVATSVSVKALCREGVELAPDAETRKMKKDAPCLVLRLIPVEPATWNGESYILFIVILHYFIYFSRYKAQC